jgi:hypothetical protein
LTKTAQRRRLVSNNRGALHVQCRAARGRFSFERRLLSLPWPKETFKSDHEA